MTMKKTGAAQPAAEKIWPAAAEKVDYDALRALPAWRGIWRPMLGKNPKPEVPHLVGNTRSIITRSRPSSAAAIRKRSSRSSVARRSASRQACRAS